MDKAWEIITEQKIINIIKACPTGEPNQETIVQVDNPYFAKGDIVRRKEDNSTFIIVSLPGTDKTLLEVISINGKSLKEGDKVVYCLNIL